MIFRRKSNQQLRITAPGYDSPAQVYLETMGLTAIICATLALVSIEFLFIPPPEDPEVVQAREEHAKLPELDRVALELSGMSFEEVRAKESWSDIERAAVLERGPRLAAERVCELIVQEGSLDSRSASALTESLSTRKEFTPRICLTRAYLRGQLVEFDELDAASAAYWERLTQFDEVSVEAALIVNTYRRSRNRPEDPRFYRWIRHCSMRPAEPEWLACASMIRQLAPMQGADMLAMSEIHLQQNSTPSRRELLDVTKMLGALAADGQPAFWKIEDHAVYKNYDAHLRRAAVFSLCRFTHSPSHAVSKGAAEQLSALVGLDMERADRRHVSRWKDACKIAFGGNRPDLEFVNEPILFENNVPALDDVWSGEDGAKPRYSLMNSIRSGNCKTFPDRPIWACGAEQWKGEGELVDDLTMYYIDTRYHDWGEALPEPITREEFEELYE